MKKLISLLVALMMVATLTPAFALDLMSGTDVYPLQTDQTLSWFVGTGYALNDAYAKWEDSPFHSGLNEMVGVNIDWQFVPVGGDAAQAFNLRVASGDYPDIVFSDRIMTDASLYLEEGFIRDLTDHMEEYSPAYMQFLRSDKAYENAMKTDEGQIYGYGFFREDGGWNDTYLGPVVRTDWLEEQNLELPVTVSDWDNALRVFNEAYGAQLSFAWSRFNTTGISGAFGAYGSSNFQLYIDDNGKVQLAQAQPEWLDYMMKLNEWWEAGLLDQDIFTLDDTAAKTKALQGAMGISITSMGQMTNWRREAEEAGNGANWVGLQYPTGDDGTLSMVFGGYGIGTTVAVVTSGCPDEKLETAMRVLDYAYTEEGNLYWNFGKQGVSWDYDADGNPAYLPLVTEDPDGLNDAISKYGGSTWSGNCIQATLLLYLKNSKESVEANDLWFYPNEAVTAKWKLPNGYTQTIEESDEINVYLNALQTYVQEQAAKYITGEAGPETFDSFVAQLDSMGLQTILQMRQQAYDRYLAR